MNFRNEWSEITSTPTDLMFYTKHETIDSVKSNFDIRRYCSAEGYSVTVDGVAEQVIVQDHTNPIHESDVDKKILLSMDSKVNTGSYVVFRKQNWIINSNINIVDDAYKICQMQYCNLTLKFQHKQTGTILSYPCITSNKTIGTGEDEGKVLTLPDGRKSVLLPYDENTISFQNGDRFFLDKHPTHPRPYKVTHVDTTTYNYGDKGLIYLILAEDEIRVGIDNVELGVCDYFSPTVIPEIPENSCHMSITSSGNLIVGGNQRTYTAKLFDENNIEQSFVAVWNVNCNGMSQSDFTIIYDGNKCFIKVKENYNYISRFITLTCSTDDGLYSVAYDVVITAGY